MSEAQAEEDTKTKNEDADERPKKKRASKKSSSRGKSSKSDKSDEGKDSKDAKGSDDKDPKDEKSSKGSGKDGKDDGDSKSSRSSKGSRSDKGGKDEKGDGDSRSSKGDGEEGGEEQRKLDYRSLAEFSSDELAKLAKAQDFEVDKGWDKNELVFEFYRYMVEKMSRGLTLSKGVLEILPEGYGFLRTQAAELDDTDVYVSQSQIRRFGLRTGDEVVGQVRPPKDNESYYALIKVEEVNDEDPEIFQGKRPIFEKLVPLFPFEKFKLERKDPKILDTRLIDMVTPMGKGQRALIVAPPKAGKTTILKNVANSILENHSEVDMIILLIDERPEEVTDMERSVEAEVVASCFDQPVANHIRVTEMVLEKAKRRVEMGRDVVILLDSITRLARAYNISVPSSGQTLSGGVNPHALYKPKRFFGSARKIEDGGSLTIIATALVETGNKMDDFIYEEFKGTGNLELILDRELFHKRLFPAVNIKQSSTRKEDLLVNDEVLKRLWVLRRVLATMKEDEALQMMLKQLGRTESNFEFLASLNKADLD